MKTSTKYLKITLNLLSAILFVLFVFLLLPKLISFFMPFVIAIIVAWMANPLVKLTEKHLKLKRKIGSIAVIVLAIALVGLIIYALVSALIYGFSEMAQSAPVWWEHVNGTINDIFDPSNGRWHLTYMQLPSSLREWVDSAVIAASESASDWVGRISDGFTETATRMASNIATTIISIIMCLIGSYFFVAEKDYLSNVLNKVLPKGLSNRINVVKETMRTAVGGYFKAQFIIMGFVYLVLFAGLLILRVKLAFIIAFLIALLDFLPFFGTGTVMVPWAILEFVNKDFKAGIGLLITWGLSQLIRQLIQPKVLSTSVGLEPIPTLILLFVGFKFGGALGLIVAVPIGMIVLNLYKAGMFSNFIYSVKILMNDFARNRKFTDEELEAEGIEVTLPGDNNE